MNLAAPSSVQKLQKALHDKAKESPKRRFHALYDKVYRRDVLAFAYACGKANGGAAGVDGQSFEDIEEYGVERCPPCRGCKLNCVNGHRKDHTRETRWPSTSISSTN